MFLDDFLDWLFGNPHKDHVYAVAIASDVTYNEAVAFCKRNGGRLPTLEEIKGVFNPNQSSSYPIGFFWTSTKALLTGCMMCSSERGTELDLPVCEKHNVICVKDSTKY